MKIYTEINYELKDGKLVQVSSESFEYDGDVAQCKGGGGTTYSQGVNYTSDMPKWAQSEHKRLMEEAAALTYGRDYKGYNYYDEVTGENLGPRPRIADLTQWERDAMGAADNIFRAGDPYGEYASEFAGIASQLPSAVQDVKSTYGGVLRGPDGQAFGLEQYQGDVADRYMNPYFENVVQQEEAAARDEYARNRIQNASEHVAQGSRGGYRAALEDVLGQSEQASTIADIRGAGASRAWESGLQAMDRDRQAYIEAVKMGDAAGQQEAKMAMEADRYNQDMIMRQAAAAGDASERFDALGANAQKRAYERQRELTRAGATNRELQQSVLDLDYQEWMNRQQWPQEQLNWLSGLIAGSPGQLKSSETRPQMGLASQLTGLGMSAAGIASLFNQGE
jgi:hypothetical protein